MDGSVAKLWTQTGTMTVGTRTDDAYPKFELCIWDRDSTQLVKAELTVGQMLDLLDIIDSQMDVALDSFSRG